MKNKCAVFLLSSLLVLIFSFSSYAQVEWDVQRTFDLEEAALDVAITPNGKWVFVLTDQGEIHIYSHEGTLKDTISVGKSVESIRPGPLDDILFLNNRKNKTLQVITLDFIQDINVSGSPFKGPIDAPVVMAVFSDFQSPNCARLVPVLNQVLSKYPDEVKLVFKSFPVSNQRLARQAAAAALAADRQGKFWQFHDQLFENYKSLNKQKIQEISEKLDMDMEKLRKDLMDSQIAAMITENITEGVKVGVRGIPAVFVNGRMARDHSPEGLQVIIDKELAKVARK